ATRTLRPYATLFRSSIAAAAATPPRCAALEPASAPPKLPIGVRTAPARWTRAANYSSRRGGRGGPAGRGPASGVRRGPVPGREEDRKSTRLHSSHVK